MSNSNLEKQAMDIMVKKAAGNGQKYSKAIITSNAWTIDRGWNNVVLSRSIVVALVSKNHDGKCMYQYFNFTQAENGSGKFSSLLQYDGAGDNVYISCDNR